MGDQAHPEDYYNRYSRQYYVLGEKAMNCMAGSNIFLSGLGGLGVEIAKNIALAGVRLLVIHDDQPADWRDLSTQYYLSPKDLGRNRAEASFGKIAELNYYVQYELDTRSINDSTTDWRFLDDFSCVVLSEKSRSVYLNVSDYCHDKGIPLIIADTFGVFGWAFSDCGETHEVFDKDDEPSREVMVQSVCREGDGAVRVTCLDNFKHKFEKGDCVRITEIQIAKDGQGNASELTGQISVAESPQWFCVETDSTAEIGTYERGGLAVQVKIPMHMHYKRFRDALLDPKCITMDFAKPDAFPSIHIAMQALYAWMDAHQGALPEPWNTDHADQILQLAKQIRGEHDFSREQPLNELLVKQLAWTACGAISPISCSFGGIVAQEVIKAISGKYMPLNQFLYFDAVELLTTEHPDQASFDASQYQSSGSRYDAQIRLLGKDLHNRIQNVRLLLVGAGAIGCEVLKNLALLGCCSCGKLGKITVTDNDVIEKSNLNRQFLFRDADLQKPKSTAAARAVKMINADMQIEAFLDKIGKETEHIYSDKFFQTLEMVVNALDNVKSRIYVDQRCVANCKPLLDPGTQGVKGHLQVILPHLTESYSSHTDSGEDVYPVCTLKSFPSSIEHTIQWALAKFNTLFSEKPKQLQIFLADPTAYVNNLRQHGSQTLSRFQVLRYIYKVLQSPPKNWNDCAQRAANKFQSYYHNMIRDLINSFPLDAKLADGSPFWALPKRPPTKLQFSASDPDHMAFVLHAATLYAKVFNVPFSEADVERTREITAKTYMMPYVAKDKKIETDPKVKEAAPAKLDQTQMDELESIVDKLTALSAMPQATHLKITPQDFEKDDDTNHHVDFITACSNLRARNYQLQIADRLETKRISGKIVPAIATTTATVSGFLCLELIKIVKKLPLSQYKNGFLNLALPYFQFSEPGPALKQYVTPDVHYTLWDRWCVELGDITVEQFIQHFQNLYKLQVTAICYGILSIYLSIIPTHRTRLKKKLVSLIKDIPKDQGYVDLIVMFQNQAGQDISGPDVRFYWQ